MKLLDDLLNWFSTWGGPSQPAKSTRTRLDALEAQVAIGQEDLAKLNAATTRIAARFTSLLDQINALGTGNDDAVRQEQQLADIQAAGEQLRPVLDQLEALGADAVNPVPAPTPEQVPVEPGPDVAPVENVGGEGTVVTDPGTAPEVPVFDDSGIAVGEGVGTSQPGPTDDGTNR